MKEMGEALIARMRRDDLKKSQIETASGHLRKHINPLLGEILVSQVVEADTERLVTRSSTTPPPGGRGVDVPDDATAERARPLINQSKERLIALGVANGLKPPNRRGSIAATGM